MRKSSKTTADTYVRARIDTAAKIVPRMRWRQWVCRFRMRLLMLWVVDERRLPFEAKAPNATTRKAIAELESARGKRFRTTVDIDKIVCKLSQRTRCSSVRRGPARCRPEEGLAR